MSKAIHAIVAAAATLFVTMAVADEAESFCALNQAQAEVQSELLGSAEAFTNLGDPNTGNHSLAVGVRKSLSKHRQARVVQQLAQAQCEAYRLENRLAEQAAHVEQRGDLVALEVMEPLLKRALEKAEANVQKEQAMLAARTARLADVKTAFDQADRLRGELVSLAERRSRLQDVLPAIDEPLNDLISASVAARGEVAALSSKVAVQSGWDVSLAAGMRSDFRSNGQREGFVAVQASFNLGKPAADRAAAKVSALTEQLLTEQHDASVQGLRRARNTVAGLAAGEAMNVFALEQRKALADSTLERLQGVDTEEGLRTQRTMTVEQLSTEAALTGSRARLRYLKAWLDRNS